MSAPFEAPILRFDGDWPQNLNEATCTTRIEELRQMVRDLEDDLDCKRDELAWYEEGQRLGFLPSETRP